MGDVAMTVPVLSAFSETHPTIKLTVLTKKQFAPLFRDLKMVSVISVDFKTDYNGVVGLYRLSKALRNTQVEAVADLHNVLRTKVLKLFLPRIKFIQIDKGRAEKKALITAKKRTPLRTMIQRYADVFRSLGFEFELDKPSFTAPKLLDAATTKKLGAFSNSSIGIAPFAAYASKTYSISKMDQVISKLQKESKVVLFGGGANETKQLEAIASKYSNVFCVAGKFSLEQELDIISNLKVMLSMDSSNGHMAAMLGVNVVTLWGVTHPSAGFAPFHQKETNNILSDQDKYPKIPTSIYGNKYPKDYLNAAGSIFPEKIIEKVQRIL